MGFFDTVINDFRRKKDDLINSRFNVVNQARSAIALAKPQIQQGVQDFSRSRFNLPAQVRSVPSFTQQVIKPQAQAAFQMVKPVVRQAQQTFRNTPLPLPTFMPKVTIGKIADTYKTQVTQPYGEGFNAMAKWS